MKLVRVAEENKRYYTKDFIHGFNVGAKTQYEADRKDAERRGLWMSNNNGTYSCNLCQSWIPAEQHHYARYCLYCGARMEAKENEND